MTCYDTDAPTGSGFWHWLVVNIPADVSELAEGAGSTGGKLPAGALQTRTDFGVPSYGGPCPPEGDHPHRYLFTVFAVKTDKLDVKADTSAAVVGFNLHFNTLARAEIMGLFGELVETPRPQSSMAWRQSGGSRQTLMASVSGG